MKRLLLAFLACSSIGTQANTVTTDFTDLWWNPSQSGWGMNLVQQEDTAFITLYVYAADRAPTWFVGSSVTYRGLENGQFVFSGPLYRATGPHFGASSFPAEDVSIVPVGSVTFRAAQATVATVTYTVDGVSVTKAVERQSWRTQDFSGSYVGALIGQDSGCPTGNGPAERASSFTITQRGFEMTMQQQAPDGYSCTYVGSYTPAGSIGMLEGISSCSDGSTRSFSMTEMRVGLDTFSGAMNTRSGACLFSGRIGGVRRN